MTPPNQLEPGGDQGTWTFVVITRWYQRKVIWIAFVVFLVGGYVAAPIAKNRFDRWNEERRLHRASTSLEKGDFKHAILDARSVLESNPQNVEANRLIARALEATGSPAALSWRIRLQSLRPDDAENSLGLARDALDAGDIAKAKGAIERLKPEETSNAVFHEISARLAMSQRDVVAAETHWEEAARLAPKEDRHPLSLATLRLGSKKPEVRAAAVATLSAIAAKPVSGVLALRILLADAQKHAHPARVKELADALVAAPGSTFADKLTRLEILRKVNAPDSTSYLSELRTTAESNPDLLYEFLMWMNQNDLALVASEWLAGLPRKIISKPPACVGVAQTYAKGGEWSKLKQMAGTGSWEELDFMRRAYLARALERLGETEMGAEEWKKAISAAQSAADGPARLERLARTAQSWRWDQRVEDVAWLLTRTGHAPRWVLDFLLVTAHQRGETAQVQTAASLIAKADPGGITARNYYTFISLLTRTEEGDPHRRAKALYEEFPTDPAVAVSYALSLYQQEQAAKAVKVMSALKPEELRAPLSAFQFYYGVFLIAADREGEAAEYLQRSLDRPLLPEEKALLDRVKAAAKKRAEEARERALQSEDAPNKQTRP